jgi:glycosyltransferase involved in cell wall biosynthesis
MTKTDELLDYREASQHADVAADRASVRHAAAFHRPTVCHVLHTLHVGGGEVLARAFARTNESEFRPVFALLDDLGDLGRELQEQGYAVQVLGRRPGFDRGCVSRLRQFFTRERVAVVHAHQYGPLLYSAVARLPRRCPSILFTEHGRDAPDYRRWKRVWANRVLLTRRDRFVAVGNEVKRALIAFEGLPARRVEVIYNGRDLSAYDPQKTEREVVRRELGLAEDAFVVMQVARLNRLKDHPTALRAIGRLVGERPHVRLVLVGDGEDRALLEEFVKELHLEDAVLLLGSRDDVPRLLQAADAFLLSSITEGIPLTLIEAMATGLPCVGTNVGGMTEVITAEDTGLLAPAGDDAELARQLRRLVDSPQLGHRLADAARRRILHRFDAATMHEQYRRLYREMTQTGSANS